MAPSGDQSNGVTWQSLGTFHITSGTLAVRLSDNANGYVIADAVRIVSNGIAPQVPEINLASQGQSIAVGDSTPSTADGTDFGAVALNTDSAVQTFTVENKGNAVLQLGGSPRVAITGAGASQFSVVTQPSATVAPGGSTSFQIVFHPTSAGVKQRW